MPNFKKTQKCFLTELPAGTRSRIKDVLGGGAIKKRLEDLGLRIGSQIEVVSAQFLRGPVTVKVGNTTLAIGHGMAGKIEVECINGRQA
jgi:Fe2+ transport system protein FeoA